MGTEVLLFLFLKRRANLTKKSEFALKLNVKKVSNDHKYLDLKQYIYNFS